MLSYFKEEGKHEQYPYNAYSHAGMGNAYFGERTKDDRYLDLAAVECTKALAMNPLLPGVHTNMGYNLLARGDSEGDVQFYTTALGMHPSDKDARLNRVIAVENLGRNEEAHKDFLLFLATPGDEFVHARPYAVERVRVLSMGNHR